MALAKHPRCALETRTGDAAVGCIPTLIFTLHPVPSFLSWLECSLAAETIFAHWGCKAGCETNDKHRSSKGLSSLPQRKRFSAYDF